MKTIYKIVLVVLISLSSTAIQAACNWKARIQQFTVTQSCNNTYKTINGSVFLFNSSGIQYRWSVSGSQINWVSSQSTYLYYPASNGTYMVQLYLKDVNNNCDTTFSKQITFNCFKTCNWQDIPIVTSFVDSCRSYGTFIKNNTINCNLRTNGGTFGFLQTNWYVNDTLKQIGGYDFSQIIQKNGKYKMCVNLIDTINHCDTLICHEFNVSCISNCNWKSKNIYLYANDSCVQNQKKYFVKGAVLMDGTPNLTYRYQWYVNNMLVGANYYSTAQRITSKSSYQICVKLTDTVKNCDTVICKTVVADCLNCQSFLPQIYSIVLSDSCVMNSQTTYRAVVGKLIYRNPAANSFYAVKWTVDTTSSSNSIYLRQAVSSNGNKRVCLVISDTLNGCDTQICKTVYVNCSFGSTIDNTKLSGLKVYPNPASKSVVLSDINTSFRFECYDVAARLVLEGYSDPGEPISVANLKNGMYALKIWTDDHFYTLRFIKQDD